MSERSVVHESIVIERTFDAPPARVFAAWSDPAARARWQVPGDDWLLVELESDFRVGGKNLSRFGPQGGPLLTSDGRYEDIVPDARIVMAGTMSREQTRLSTSVLTVELVPAGVGRTRLILTEQAAFLDGGDNRASREQGWGGMLVKLDLELLRAATTQPH